MIRKPVAKVAADVSGIKRGNTNSILNCFELKHLKDMPIEAVSVRADDFQST